MGQNIIIHLQHAISGHAAIQAFWQGWIDMGNGALQRQPAEVDHLNETVNEVGVYTLYSRDGKLLDVGSRTTNVVPTPNVLSTLMSPLCISTIFLAIDSPKPLPPSARLRDLSALKKRSKTRA